jgi:hypothetical protein
MTVATFPRPFLPIAELPTGGREQQERSRRRVQIRAKRPDGMPLVFVEAAVHPSCSTRQ